MILKIPGMLKAEQAAELRASLMSAPWVDGEITAGAQSTLAKHNLQAPEHDPLVQALGRAVLDALRIHPTFVAAALPLRVFPPLFNRYDQGMEFGRPCRQRHPLFRYGPLPNGLVGHPLPERP